MTFFFLPSPPAAWRWAEPHMARVPVLPPARQGVPRRPHPPLPRRHPRPPVPSPSSPSPLTAPFKFENVAHFPSSKLRDFYANCCCFSYVFHNCFTFCHTFPPTFLQLRSFLVHPLNKMRTFPPSKVYNFTLFCILLISPLQSFLSH